MISVIENDGRLYYEPRFIARREAAELHEELLDQLAWSRESIRIYGKTIESPRLVAWYGEREAIYRYSGIVHFPLPWHPLLSIIKSRLESYSNQSFNSVLCNCYRDGKDSLGWHADKERELGPDPTIGSVSLGATRTFRIRHRLSGDTYDISMESGSLIIMAGCLQRYWRHCVPKTCEALRPRISLSFRSIVPSANEE
ncbi:MAG: alpha-ketoglutarate-dependent dioxygenase AlkB family protein [Gammaproteobacteria bacterium]